MNFNRNIVSSEAPLTLTEDMMRAGIEVESREEADLIRKGLEDPATRALVKVMGALSALPTDRARKRVMTHVVDYFEEQAEEKPAP